MSVKTLINEIKFINENIKENKGVFTIKVKKLNLLLKYIDELEEELEFEKSICSNQAQRILKAREYIKEHKFTNPHLASLLVDSEITELENILKGEE